MGIDFEIKAEIPDLTLEIENEPEVVGIMARTIAEEITGRLERGRGSKGALQRPKDGGKPLIKTGELLGSIEGYPSKRDPKSWVVAPTGKRTGDEIAFKKKSARLKTKRMRQRKRDAMFMRAQRSPELMAKLDGMTRRQRTKMLKLSEIRFRTADTNAALAAILSVAPKDKRAKNGKRAEYRVFEQVAEDFEKASRVAGAHVQRRWRADQYLVIDAKTRRAVGRPVAQTSMAGRGRAGMAIFKRDAAARAARIKLRSKGK